MNGYWVSPLVFFCLDQEELAAAGGELLPILPRGVVVAVYISTLVVGGGHFHAFDAGRRYMVRASPDFRIQASNPRGEAAEDHDAQGLRTDNLVGPLVQIDRCAPVRARGEGRALVLDYRDQAMRYFLVAAVNGLLYADLGRPDGGPSAP